MLASWCLTVKPDEDIYHKIMPLIDSWYMITFVSPQLPIDWYLIIGEGSKACIGETMLRWRDGLWGRSFSNDFENYGLTTSLAYLRNIAKTSLEGTTALGLVKTAEKLGFETKAIQADMSLSRYKIYHCHSLCMLPKMGIYSIFMSL